MSLITDDPESSPRDCSSRRKRSSRRRKRALIAASSTVASLLSLGVIFLWLTLLRPSSPVFSLVAATATLTNNGSVIVIHAAFSARNPNGHASALYDELQARACSYDGVPLDASAPLPPLEQPAEGDVVMSALLKSSTAGITISMDDGMLRTRVEGQLRWKVANWWVSGRHGLAVDCVVVVPSGGVVQQGQCATRVLSGPNK